MNEKKTKAPPDQEIAQEEAIAWAVKLAAGQVDPADQQAFHHWRGQSRDNERAWRQIEGINDEFAALRSGAGDAVRHTLNRLDRQRSTRRTVLKYIVGGVFLSGGGLIWSRKPWQKKWTLSAAAGQRTHRILPDGSRIDLNRSSHVEVVFSPLRRQIFLHQGEIHIKTGEDADALFGHRGFEVISGATTFRALGTAFNLRCKDGGHQLYVSDGKVAVYRHAVLEKIVSAPGGSFVPQNGAIKEGTPDYNPSTWIKGVLVARKMRLLDLVAELSRYDDRRLTCSSNVVDFRVSGVFQLEGSAPVARALEVLRQTLPIDIVERNGTLTIVLIRP